MTMKVHNQYIKPETKVIHIAQECPLMAGSDGDTGIDENPHGEVLDPGQQQLAKPSGPFSGSTMWGD